MSKFYITTAIAYVNAPPHVGHALEFIQADVLARYHRLVGDDTYYLTGTDEHGVKVYETAQKAGEDTQVFVDRHADIYKSLEDILDLSNDGFVRTTDEGHKSACKKLWMKMVDAGDIYKDVYKGNYCVGCEAFIPEKDLDEDGNCPNHNKKPEILEEENYFFRLSKYSDRIKEAIEKDEMKIVPVARKNEMLNIIGEEGLFDVSFSRPKSVLPWGVSVPNDDTQVMYVWGDALSNYITHIGYEEESEQFKKLWPCDVHLIGKDILRFHAGIWIGMLMSAGLDLPKSIYVHGFVTSEGKKMSKSLGNVVDPLHYANTYGSDALRYFLIREVPTTDDGDFSHGRFVDVVNSELANGLGNLVNRVTMMTEKYFEGKVPRECDGGEFAKKLSGLVGDYHKAFEGFDLKVACEVLMNVVDLGNKYIDDTKPWAMAKAADKGLGDVMYNLLELVRQVAVLASVFVPKAANNIFDQLCVSDEGKTSLQWGYLKEGGAVKSAGVLFPRIEE